MTDDDWEKKLLSFLGGGKFVESTVLVNGSRGGSGVESSRVESSGVESSGVESNEVEFFSSEFEIIKKNHGRVGWWVGGSVGWWVDG